MKVIECNVRVFRFLLFVFKILDYDFIFTVIRVIMGEVVELINVLYGCGRVGVKVGFYLKLIDYIDNTNDRYMDNLFKVYFF